MFFNNWRPIDCSCTKNALECQGNPGCSGVWSVKYYKLDDPERLIQAEFCSNDVRFYCEVLKHERNWFPPTDHVYQIFCNDKDMCNRDLRLPKHIAGKSVRFLDIYF